MLCPFAYSRAKLLIDPSLRDSDSQQVDTLLAVGPAYGSFGRGRGNCGRTCAQRRMAPSAILSQFVSFRLQSAPARRKTLTRRTHGRTRKKGLVGRLLALLFTFQYCPSIIGAHGSSRTEHMIRQELMQDLSSNAGNALRNRRCNGKDYAEAGVTQFANWAGRRQKWSLWLSGMQWWARADPFCIISK